MTARVRVIESRSNDLLKALRRLVSDPVGYRRFGRAWIEGEHLCRALLEHGGRPREAVVTASAWQQPAWHRLAEAAPEVMVIPDAEMRELSGLESPAPLAFLFDVPAVGAAPQARLRTVVLDRLQDPGNAGSILRTAAAMGFRQVVALKGTVALWSPKVLRAGMGAHFGLTLVEGASAESLGALGVPLVATHLHDARPMHDAPLPDPLAWVLGHEGQGVDEALAAACDLRVMIPQPGGEESLNVAAAAAICLYETARRAMLGALRP
jgi:TrmH family RNA methyltransferase